MRQKHRMTVVHIIVTILLCMMTTQVVSAQGSISKPTLPTNARLPEYTDPISTSDKVQLQMDISKEMDSSFQRYTRNVQADTVSKVILFLFGIATVIISAFGNATKDPDKKTTLSMATTIVAGITLAFTGFSSNTFNYSGRQHIYRIKTDQLSDLLTELHYGRPSKANFIQRYVAIRSLGDNSTSSDISAAISGQSPSD